MTPLSLDDYRRLVAEYIGQDPLVANASKAGQAAEPIGKN
jgi:hypothetical protein